MATKPTPKTREQRILAAREKMGPIGARHRAAEKAAVSACVTAVLVTAAGTGAYLRGK